MIFNAPLFLASSSSYLASLQNGLIDYWALNGNADNDISNRHGTLSGSGFFDVGKNSECFYGDSTSYIHVPYGEDKKPTGSLSVSFWLYYDTVPSWGDPTGSLAVAEDQIDSYSTTAHRWSFEAQVFTPSNDFKSYWAIRNNNGTNFDLLEYFSTTSDVTGSWNHYVLTYNNSTASAYLNGAPVTSSIATASLPATSNSKDLFISGRPRVNVSSLTGRIDEFTIWDRALSPTEIVNLYYAGAGRFYPFT
jgi:hypothetical protein